MPGMSYDICTGNTASSVVLGQPRPAYESNEGVGVGVCVAVRKGITNYSGMIAVKLDWRLTQLSGSISYPVQPISYPVQSVIWQ